MTVTPDTVVVDVGSDVGLPRWTGIILDGGGSAEAASSGGYHAMLRYRVSPAFALAIFKHESRFGTAGIVPQYDLRNPGATRSTRTGNGRVVQIPGRGPFVKYTTWADGWADLAFRLVDPAYVYAREGRRTIRQIIERWAPSSDGNAPDSYVAAVVRSMNEWITDVPTEFSLQPCLIAEGRQNRPGHTLTPTWITIHETANTRAGADAKAHCDYVRSDAAASRPASWHVTVDDRSGFHHLPYTEVAWHAGDGSNGQGNRNSLSIELCVNSDGDWERTMQNAATVVRGWMSQFGIPLDNVVQHNHWSDTSCPARLAGGDWPRFLALLTDAPTEETERIINGYTVRGPFLTAYAQLEHNGAHWWTFGVPDGAEVPGVPVDGVERIVQPWDRAGWVMTEGGGVVIAKPGQQTQIRRDLGIETGHDVRVSAVREAARAARDQIDVILGEVAE